MKHRLPPLNSLRAFEAAGRHLSFKAAARELNVTPAAISQQIKILEEQVGHPLFERLTRALKLTEIGRKALPALHEAFDKLAEASDILRDQNTHYLTVSVSPSFGAKWLVPRLDRFRDQHPDLDLRLDASDQLASFVGDGVDVAIRYGRGIYGDFITDCLMPVNAFPVCSPTMSSHRSPLNNPADLANCTLLHTQWTVDDETSPSWRMWLAAAGVDNVEWDRGPRFSNASMAVEAAAEGHGVALASGELVEKELASGRLIRPFPASIRDSTEFSYFLVYPANRCGDEKIVAFHDWVLSEIKG